MNYPKAFLSVLLLFTTLHAKDAAVRIEKKEGEAFAAALRPLFLENGQLGFSEQELLSSSDQEKTFNPDQAERQLQNLQGETVVTELSDFLHKTLKKEQVEETEKVFVLGQSVLDNPQNSLGGMVIRSRTIPEEEKLEKCQEEGCYRTTFAQTRVVEVTPEVKQKVKHCLGHKKKKNLFWHADVDDRIKKKKKEFSKNPKIAFYEVYSDKSIFDKSTVIMEWTHVDNCEDCDQYRVEEKVLEPQKEIDRWVADLPNLAARLESAPTCKLIYSQIVQGPETRIIQGKSIFRDIWKQQMFFSCAPNQDSKCARLRQLGGVLVSKKCVLENEFKECDLWEKVYDLGGKAAYVEQNIAFEDPALINLNASEDTAYDKNTEFGKAVTILSVFSDLEKSLESSQTNFKDAEARVFPGERKKCTRSFLNGEVYDCCSKMEGLAVKAKMANCNTEEQSLAIMRSDGKCHYIGSHSVKLGTQTEQVYCCYPTKLSRVIHEEGRQQLGIEWGSPDKPKCRGLTVEELQKIDFSSMDLSEIIDDFQVDKEKLAQKIQGTLQSLEAKSKKELHAKTQKVVEKERASHGIM